MGNGDTVNLTVKVLQRDPIGAEVFVLKSTLGARTTWWWGLVQG